jgi:hypothetical protein
MHACASPRPSDYPLDSRMDLWVRRLATGYGLMGLSDGVMAWGWCPSEIAGAESVVVDRTLGMAWIGERECSGGMGRL